MEQFKEKIKKAETLKQIFDVVNEHYETTEKMGVFTGGIVKNKIPELVKMLNLKPKK